MSWGSAVRRSTAGINAGELGRDLEGVRYGPRPPVPSKLDPYKAIVRERLEERQHVDLFNTLRSNPSQQGDRDVNLRLVTSGRVSHFHPPHVSLFGRH